MCGGLLTDSNVSDEHVFPKWLLHKYDLWNQRLCLFNETLIPYKNLTIPCCNDCNGVYLSKLENDIKSAIEHGYKSFMELDEITIFKWMTKLFYGLLFKDLSLSVDRANPQKGHLMEPEMLSKFKIVHVFLQSVKPKVKFTGNVFSLFVFNVHTNPKNDNKLDFFFSDDLLRLQLAIQVGDTGIICCIGEDGIIKESLDNYLKPFYSIKIHPIQFREIIGRVFYKKYILQVPPAYIFVNSEDECSIVSMLSSFTGKYFADIKQKELAYFIYKQLKPLGFTEEDIYHTKLDAVTSYLTNHYGNVHLIDQYGNVISDVTIKHNGYKGDLFPPKNNKPNN